MSRTARRIGLACVGVGVLLVGGGVALALGTDGTPVPAAVPVTDVGRVPTGQVQAAPGGAAGRSRPPARHRANHPPPGPTTLARGAQLRVGGSTAPVGRVRVVDREMQIPLDPRKVGWWRASAVPGSSSGSVVIVGHVNYAGVTGALAVLPHLRPGDAVSIGAPGHRYRYAVTGVRTYPKATGLPAQVFARGGRSRLVLITCGGPFDSATGNYEDNVVAYAVPQS